MKNKSYVKVYDATTVYFLWDNKLQRYFKGVAVCRGKDTFDADYGVKVAKAKAILAMREFNVAACESFMKYMDSLMAVLPEVEKNHDYWTEKVKESKALVYDLSKN